MSFCLEETKAVGVRLGFHWNRLRRCINPRRLRDCPAWALAEMGTIALTSRSSRV
jgi:predicted secreted hydrolase